MILPDFDTVCLACVHFMSKTIRSGLSFVCRSWADGSYQHAGTWSESSNVKAQQMQLSRSEQTMLINHRCKHAFASFEKRAPVIAEQCGLNLFDFHTHSEKLLYVIP